MSARRLRPVAAGAAAVLLGAAALLTLPLVLGRCRVYTPDLLLPEAGPTSGDGVGFWSKPLPGNGCFSAGMPTPADRPKPSAAPPLPPITLALRTMRLGGYDKSGEKSSTAWEDIGFDIDGVCTNSPTCSGDPLNPQLSCARTGNTTPFDGNYCRDNTFGRLQVVAETVSQIAKTYGLSDEAFNCALCVGDYNFLIKLSDYNGQADDDHVRVDLYPSPGLDKPLPWDCSTPDWHSDPCFNADLPFTIEDDSVTEPRGGPDLPPAKLFDDTAYVRDGYVVTTLPDRTLFWFPGAKKALATAFPLQLEKGIVAGRIARAQDGTWTIQDGIIAGRATTDSIIHGFRLIGFCEADPSYSLMTDFLHGNADVLGSGANDPATPCDAISVGIGFTAAQATAGALVHVDPLAECAGSPAADAGAD